MIAGLERVKSRRVWFVPGFVVWGLSSAGEIAFITTESVGGTTSVLYGETSVGQADQEVLYKDLTDFRGNKLPDEIESPRVMPRSRSEHVTFVAEPETNSSFKIARDPEGPATVTVDLMIMEMGE